MNWMKRIYAWTQESGRNVAISLALCFVVAWIGFGLMQTPTTSASTTSGTYYQRGIYMPWSPAPVIILPGGGFGSEPSRVPAPSNPSTSSSSQPAVPSGSNTNRTDSPSWGSSKPASPSIASPSRSDAPSWGSSKAPSRSIGGRRR